MMKLNEIDSKWLVAVVAIVLAMASGGFLMSFRDKAEIHATMTEMRTEMQNNQKDMDHQFELMKMNFTLIQQRLDSVNGDGWTYTDMKERAEVWEGLNPELNLPMPARRKASPW